MPRRPLASRLPRRSPATLAAAATLTALLLPAPARAQLRSEALGLSLSATPAAGTDYLFRGISQTRGRPAGQLTLEALHDSGFYLGGFASNVAFAGTDARQEVDLLAGYRFGGLGIDWDIGAIAYLYPGYQRPAGGYAIDYVEAALRGTRAFGPVTATAAVNVSPDYFGQSGQALALEGGADIALPLDLTLSARIGHQWIERPARFGTPEYLWFSAGLSHALPGGLLLTASYAGTSIDQAGCGGGQKICDNRAMLTLSRKF